MIVSHLDLAKAWDQRGNRRMVRVIAKSYFRLMKMYERQQLGGHGAQ